MMRKKSREMDAAWAMEVMDNAPYITVSMTDTEGLPYSVPLSLARLDESTFCFHCAKEGKNWSALRRIPMFALLLNQVYQFSRMYWKSVKQQNLPITTKYPDMVAEIVPHFSEAELPQFGKNNLWFL